MMQVPAILYGEVKVVRQRCKDALRHWLLGTPYIAAMESPGVYDVADIPTPISLETWCGDWSCGLYLSMPTHLLLGTKGLLIPKRGGFDRDDPRITAYFDACLTRPWSILSLLQTQDAHIFFGPEAQLRLDRYQRLIAAVLRDCDELEAVGPRYGPGVNGPVYLAQCAYKVYQGLRALSYPTERLRDLILGHGYPVSLEPGGGLRGVLAALGVSIDPALAPARLPDQPTVLPAPPTPPAPRPVDPDKYWMSQTMEEALEARDRQTIMRLVTEGESSTRINENLETAFSWALRQGDTDLVTFLLEHGAQVEGRGSEGESPLMVAAVEGHMAIVRLLLARGAKVRYRTHSGWDARDYAKMGGHPAIEALLLEAWKGGVHRKQAISDGVIE